MKTLTIKGEKVVNVPNILSFYRLIISPYILYLILSGQESLYGIFLCISLVSDVLDGNIARTFKLQTKFGAALDNIADMCTYVLAFTGMFIFKGDEILPDAMLFYIFIGTLILSYIVAFAKFGKVPGMHLYLPVTSGYMQGIFFFVLFSFGYVDWLFWTVCIWGTVAYFEKIIILLRIKEIKSGLKGLYWVLKNEKNSAQ